LGTAEDGRLLTIGARGAGVLVAGTSGSGKSTFAAGLLERVAERGHQFCIVDPEGDYEGFAGAVTVGDADHPPDLDEAFELLRQPGQNVVVNMLGIAMADRPALFAEFLHRLQSLRSETGRPHWLAVDEAHHMLPVERAGSALPQIPGGAMLVTVHP